MDDLLKEMDNTNSDTSIVDFNFESDDDEEFLNENIIPNQAIQEKVEIATQEEQVNKEKTLLIQGQQDIQMQNNFEQQVEYNVTSLQNYHYRNQPKLIKRKQPRECNLQQGYQIIKTFGHYAHTSYQNVKQKKEQAIVKITNYVISGVEKIKRL